MELSPAQKRHLAEKGYVVVPGVVPPERVAAAKRQINHALGAGKHPGKDAYADTQDYLSEYVSTPQIMDLVYRTPVWDLVESLLGVNRVDRCTQAQVALRFPAENDEVVAQSSVHIDGMYSTKANAPIVRYTLCLGVFLSDAPKKDMGNFLAYAGTHTKIAERIKKLGVGSMKSGISKSIELPEPEQVTGKAGDVLIFHFQLAHDKGRNLSPFIRYMTYFRFWHLDAWHDKSPAYLKRALTDLWLEWPAMRGVHGT